MDPNNLNKWLTLSANIGVLVGIIFLALEIRYTRSSMELQALESFLESYSPFNELIASDTESAGTFIKGMYRPDSLTDAEVMQFSMMVILLQNQTNRIRLLRNEGLATEEQFQDMLHQFAWVLESPGGQIWRENFPRFEGSPWQEAIEPYLGRPPPLNFLLDRDPGEIRNE